MGWGYPLSTRHLRPAVTTLTFGLLVVARTQSIAAAIALALLGAIAAQRTSTRIAIATIGALTVAGVPWIASPLIAGVVWLLLTYRRDTRDRLHASIAALRGRSVGVAVGLGLAAGLIAAPFSQTQTNATPIVFDIVAPNPPVLVAIVIVLALANSVGEELLWRGALNQEARAMPVLVQYALQAVSFGVAHWHGLPGGLPGCLLTAVASVLFLGIHRRWGMATSILAHVAADLAIFTAVLPLVLFTGWAATQ